MKMKVFLAIFLFLEPQASLHMVKDEMAMAKDYFLLHAWMISFFAFLLVHSLLEDCWQKRYKEIGKRWVLFSSKSQEKGQKKTVWAISWEGYLDRICQVQPTITTYIIWVKADSAGHLADDGNRTVDLTSKSPATAPNSVGVIYIKLPNVWKLLKQTRHSNNWGEGRLESFLTKHSNISCLPKCVFLERKQRRWTTETKAVYLCCRHSGILQEISPLDF